MRVLQKAGLGLTVAIAACSSGDSNAGQACSDCADLRVIGRLDFAAAPTLPSPSGLLVPEPSGSQYAFVDRNVPYEVLFFDPDGGYRTKLGERGDGPGQFDRVLAMAFDSAGTLWVSSHSGRRLQLFDRDLELLETLQLDYSVSDLVYARGGMAVALSRESMGYIGLFDRPGKIQFLWQDSVPGGSAFASGVTDLVVGADGSVFFAEEFEYSVWRSSPDGTLVPVLGTEPEWFRSEYPQELTNAVPRISTRGSTIWDLSIVNDTLWITSAVPSLNVTIDELQGFLEDPPSFSSEIQEALLEFVVEAVDLRSGETVVGATRVSGVSYGPLEYRVAAPELVEVLALQRRGEGTN
ncbi:MAG: hypothetical protein RLN75_04135 [Longimicrobiales bacterium]